MSCLIRMCIRDVRRTLSTPRATDSYFVLSNCASVCQLKVTFLLQEFAGGVGARWCIPIIPVMGVAVWQIS